MNTESVNVPALGATMSESSSDLSVHLETLRKAAAGTRVATKRLIAASVALGCVLVQSVPLRSLPRNYTRVTYSSRHGSDTYLMADHFCGLTDFEYGPCGCVTGLVDCSQGGFLHGDFQAPDLDATTRAVALRFARDVAGGLLPDITAALEARTAQDNAAATVLELARVS